MGKERALIGSLGVSCSQALQSPVVTNPVVELLALTRLSDFAFTSAVNPVNLAARLGNYQHVAVVHNFYLGVAQKSVGGLQDGVNSSGTSGSGGFGLFDYGKGTSDCRSSIRRRDERRINSPGRGRCPAVARRIAYPSAGWRRQGLL